MTIRDFAAIEIRDQLTVAIRAGMCEGDSASATRYELSVPRETLGSMAEVGSVFWHDRELFSGARCRDGLAPATG